MWKRRQASSVGLSRGHRWCNESTYSNAGADRLLEQARAESDPATRRALYEQLVQPVGADLPLIYLCTTRNILGVSRKVRGVVLLANGLLLPLQGVRLVP